jgi:DNA-binding Lrp family transcriptional regulator
MIELDVKDRKIIYHLSNNARISDTQLSKQVALSKNAVKYRIERLKKEGVIKHLAAVINIGALGLDTFTLLLKFNDDIYENKDILDYFRKHEYVDWLITLSGQWDLFVEMVTKDLNHFHELIKDMTQHFGELLNTYQVFFSANTLRVEHLIADFYKELKVEELSIKKRTTEKHKIDETDKKILNLLNQDSSLPYLSMAQKLNLSIDIVRYRMKNMIEKGIIIKFFPEIDLAKLGYTEYLYTLKLKNTSKEKMERLKTRITANQNITYAFLDTNSFTIIFVCAFRNPEGIDHLSRSLRKDFSDMIDSQDYLIIKEQILFNLFPKGMDEGKK